jgi:hypothetical protein
MTNSTSRFRYDWCISLSEVILKIGQSKLVTDIVNVYLPQPCFPAEAQCFDVSFYWRQDLFVKTSWICTIYAHKAMDSQTPPHSQFESRNSSSKLCMIRFMPNLHRSQHAVKLVHMSETFSLFLQFVLKEASVSMVSYTVQNAVGFCNVSCETCRNMKRS